MTTENSSKKSSEIKKNRANPVEKIEEVFSNSTLFKTHVNNAEDFYKKFDKSNFFAISKLTSKILKTKGRTILKKEQRKIANQIAEKYRSALLRKQKFVEDQICNDDTEIVEEQTTQPTKNIGIADKINVSRILILFCFEKNNIFTEHMTYFK